MLELKSLSRVIMAAFSSAGLSFFSSRRRMIFFCSSISFCSSCCLPWSSWFVSFCCSKRFSSASRFIWALVSRSSWFFLMAAMA